ncbi:centrosome-associated protein ALMS1 isoform X2 [Hippopotamus amphibius kiboko]|uniref:centrosome-associated protein ALMS1 isoform X2 n=1 Tax=Hippopotamus amphibius kiboko TaxID=575201 RepID=UPI0025930049|nr:centrosome-associated protein ALMS1 isoform X2 [Hippopotamus amphibius kiboko]
MEPEDLPWPGELEEEEEAEETEEAGNLDENEVVMVEEMEEEEAREPDADFNYESQRRESTDDEDDEEAKAWLQAHPGGTLPPASLPRHRYLEGELTSPGKVVPLTCPVWQQPLYQNNNGTQISDTDVVSLEKTPQWDSGDDQRTESWHCLPQEMDSSHTLDTTQTRFNVREKGTEVTDFPSLEEGILTQSENQVKEPNRDLLCSPLLVIQDNFASPDLPLLTCLTKDQVFEPDSLLHQSELEFAPLRGVPGKSEDTEWFSRPSEASEALFQAASEVASDLVNSCFSVSQHPLIGSTAIESQRSLLTPEQGTKEETVSSDTLDDLKTSKDSDSYDALYSYMSWKTREVIQEPETNVADEDQVSFSTASDTSDEYIIPKGNDNFDASSSYVQYGKQGTLQQSGKYLISKDHDSYSDSSDTIDKNEIPKGSDNFSVPFPNMPWSKQGASHHPEICLVSKDCVSFTRKVAPHFNSKMPHSFLHCLLERGGIEVPLTSDSHYFENIYLRAPAENEMNQKMDSLGGYKRNEEDLGKELSQCFELKENRYTVVLSEVRPRSLEIQYIENVVVPDNSVEVSEAHILSRGHDTSKMDVSGGPLQTLKSNLDETSEQLCFQEERNQKATSAFGGRNVDATENVAFQAVIASIEPSEKESTVNEIHTDINKSLTNDSQESESKNPDLSLLNYDENFFFDKLNHPIYQSTPGVFESAASKTLLCKKDDGDSSLYWHPSLKSLPSAPREIVIKPLSLSPELKSSSSLCEKSLRQAIGLGKTQSALFQYEIDNEPFLPIGKIQSVSALDLTEKLGSSNIIYPMKVWTSDSLVLQDLEQHTFEEVADSSNCILGKNVNSSNIIEGPSAAVGSSFSANLVACDAKSQGALPVISDASLITVGQKTLLKADIGQGEIPRPIGPKSSFTIHTIMQNDSYFVEGLQGKSESDICSLGDDTECCSLDENAVVCSKRVAELQREIRDQGDLTGECIELAGLENMLDDLEICDSSLHWQSAVQLPSKEEGSFEEPVCPSNMDINQSFSSVLPPFVPHEPTRGLEYHSSDLRMLRVSPDTGPSTLKYSVGDTSKGGVAEIPQSTLKPGITTSPEDSDTVSHLSLSPEDFPQLAGTSPQVKNIGQHTDTLTQETLAGSHLTEETLKASAVPGLADQKTGIATVPFSSYSQRGKPNIFYPQASSGHLTEEALKVAAIPGLGDQKTGISVVPPSSYSLGEKHSIFYPQALPDSHQTEGALNVSVLPRLADQKIGKPTVPASSYRVGEEPGIFYQQALSGSHLPEEALKVSASPRPVDQKTGLPTASSTSYLHGEKPRIFYQQTLPDNHLTEQAQKVSAVPAWAEQKTGIPTIPSTSYLHREKPSIVYQQELPDSHLIQQVQQVSAAPGLAEQKTGIPTIPSASFSHREKPTILYQQELPDSHRIQEVQQVSAAPGLAEQKTGIPTVPSISYSHREKPTIVYHQELPDSHLIQEIQQVSAVPGLAEQKTGIPTIPSTSYSHREKPHIFYQQELPDSRLAEQAQKISSVPGLAEHKTGIPTVPSISYSHREKPTIVYQQELPDSHLIQEIQQVSAVPGLAEQKTGIPTIPSTSYSHREKPSILYQQELPDSHLTEQAQKVSAAPGPPEQKTGIPIVTSASYSHREKPSIFYQQDLPDSHLTKEAQKVPAVPGLAPQKSGIPIAPPAFYSHRRNSSLFYQQELPDSHLSDQTQKIAAIPEPVDQNTGIQTVPSSSSYSHREKPIIFYQQELPDSLLTEEALKVSAFPRTADQNTGIPTESSRAYSFGEKPGGLFYQQMLPDGNLTEEALKVSPASGSRDQKSVILSVPASSYSHREKPSIFYPQALPGSHLSEEALKDSAIPGPAHQKTGTSELSGSYSHREKSSIFYQQELPDSHLTGEVLKVSGVSGTSDQKTGIPIATSASYLHKEKPIILYQQALPDGYLTEEALNVSAAPGPDDQKTGIPTVSSSSYPYRGKPIISYQQELPDLTQVALKVLEVPGPADQKIGIPAVTSTSYSYGEKPIISYQQELPDPNEDALKRLEVPGQADQSTGMQIVPPASYSHRESPIFSYQELPDVTEETLEASAIPGPADQKTGIQTVPSSSYSYREKADVFYQQELPDLTEEALKGFALPGSADQNAEIPTGSSSSYLHKEKPKILPDDQNTELPSAPRSSYSHREKPKTSTVIGPDDQKTPLMTGFPNSYSQRVKPSIFFQHQLPDRHQSGDILKISPVPEPTDVNSRIPVPLASSYSHREKSNIFYPQELPDKHLTADSLKVSTVSGPAEQKTLLPAVPPSSFSHREKPNISYQQDLPERHLTEDNLKFSSSLGQAGQITGLSAVLPGTYSHSEKHKLVSDHVQRLIDNLDSSDASGISNNIPLNSQADSRVVIHKPESSGFEDVGSEEIRDTENSSKTLKEIQTLLMEAENIALRRCNFPVPLVPFRDVSDISFIQSKKVVCFKEPPTTDESNGDLSQRQPLTEESPSSKGIQKDISTQTNLKCQRGIENWEFISSTTVRSPLQEAESKARVALDETLRQYKAARSVMRSEPEGYSRTIGNKIVIPMMTIIKSDSSSDASSCSWDSNSLESVSDVLLNFFPYSSPKTSMTDSREEEGVLESDDGGGSSVDSLAAHVKNLLKCESSLNHAKQILRNAEEEESRVRARAWNLKFNMAHECGYSISELNEDDRRKVEEIKAKLFGHGRTTEVSKGLQSPRGIGCKPEAVCSHIIIESHEKGCFRTLTAERPQLDSHPCVFRSAEPSEMIRGQRSPSSWRTRHINLSKSLDQNNSHFKVWNSLQLQSHSPFQNFIDDLKISKGLQMPFREKLDPWLSELVEPAYMPSEEMDCHSSSQMLPPEPMKKFTTSVTFSSHRHSKCFSDSSFLKVGVTEGSQCTGASVGVVNSHFTEEQNPPGDLKEKTSSLSSFKIISQSPDKAVTTLAENSRQSQKLSVEHSHQEEKPLERSEFKGSHSKPSTSVNDSNFKEVHFSDNHTVISMGRPSSTLEVKEKNITVTPDLPSHIFLKQELFEQSKAPHADHHVRKHHSPPPQHQDYIAPDLPCRIFLEKRELFKQSKAPHADHQLRENHSPLPQSQDYIASDLPSSIFLEQRQLFEQSKAPDVDHHVRKHHSPLPQGQDCIVEKNNEHKPKLHISDMVNVEAKFSDVVSPSAPNQCTVGTSASTPPPNRKALSCIRITLCPKTPSKLDSGTLDKRFHSLDPVSKTRMNSEFNSDLQTISSRSLEPTSKLLTSKPVAQEQESLDFLGPKSSPDFQVVQSPLPDSNIISQDLKTVPFQNSQIVTSRQTQVNISDLEGYSSPEGTPVSADRSPEEIKTPFSPFPGKLSSDAVTQITTESPGKAMFSSEIFVNAEDRGRDIPELSTHKLGKAPVKFASSSSVQQITVPHGTDGQPLLLPYKPSGSTKMYYVPQLRQIPSSLDSKSDTTIESSHSGSNDAIAPDFPAQVLGTRNDDLADTVNIKHKEGIYSKRAVTKASLSTGKKPSQKDNADAQVQVLITGDEDLSDKKQKKEIYSKRVVTEAAQSEEKESLRKDTADSSAFAASVHSTQLQDTKIDSLPDTKIIKQKEGIHSKSTVPKEAWPEEKKSLQIDIAESRCHSEFENTTHSVFRSAKFYFHHPVHLPSDQDFCHESLGRNVFMRHSWKDIFQHHPDKQREHTCLPSPYQNVEKTKSDYTRIESLSINVNLENKEAKHATKSQARDFPKYDKQVNDLKMDHKATPGLKTQHTVSLNELWNRYQERQRQQKPPEFSVKKELSLVERLDRLAKLLQHPITHSLQPSESTQDDSRGDQDVKDWRGRQQQQKNKLQKKKRYKSLDKCHKNTGDLKKNKALSTHQAGRSNQIKIEQIKFDKYILRKQPGFHYINNTSSDSRHSEESELLTDTATNILSTTTSPVESDILTQTDKEVTFHERSSSISTIDTARLIHAFGHERVCLSPRQIKLYSSITDHQRRYLEKRSKKNKKTLNTGYPQITSEHTRRKHIQVTDHISSDSVSSSTSSFWSSSSTLCNKQNVHMLNKGIQAGNLEIVNGVRKHTRDVGVTFPTPSSSEARVEEDSDVTSWSEEKIEEKRLLTNYLGDKRLRKNKQSCCEGVSWFVPVENVKSGPKKENMPKLHGPGVSWFAPITNTRPWREPLREQNWQGQHMDSHGSLAGPGRDPLKPFVRATLQESLQLHRPDFISRSGERIKRLKLIVQERKLQNMLQSEREALFNTVREWQGCRDPMHLLPKRGFLTAEKKKPIGKKEMIQRSKRIYEQLPEVQKKKEEEKRRSEYKSYRLRAQLYKKKVTNQLLGRKVPWD